MTKHRNKEAKKSLDSNTPLLLGGFAAIAVFFLLSQKSNSDSVSLIDDPGQTLADPALRMIADAAGQFWRAFAAPTGMTLAQFKAGIYSVKEARDTSWYKNPMVSGGDIADIYKLLALAEADVAIQQPCSQNQFMAIIVRAYKRFATTATNTQQKQDTHTTTNTAFSSNSTPTNSTQQFMNATNR